MPGKNVTQECTELPANVHSKGLQPNNHDMWGMDYYLPMLEMQMAIIFIIAQVLYVILRRFEISKFTCHLLTGIFLGPSLLGHNQKGFTAKAFPVKNQEVISVLGELGYALFLFVLGAKMEMEMIMRNGHKPVVTGILCMFVPLISSVLIHKQIDYNVFHLSLSESNGLVLTTAVHSVTAFPVVAVLLEDLKLLNSEIGRFGLTATLICDSFGVLIQFIGRTIAQLQEKQKKLVMPAKLGLGLAIGYLVCVVVIFRPMMFWVVRQTPENQPVKKRYVNTLITAVLFFGILTHIWGQSFHFGPFIFGLAVPAGRPLGSAVEEKFKLFVAEVLLPVYVAIYAMRADFWSINFSDSATQLTALLIIFAFVVKILATMAIPWYNGMPFNDAFVLALILSSKGIVHLSNYTIYRDNKYVNDSVYSLTVASILVTAIAVPHLVMRLYHPSKKYAGYERRDIMHLKPNADLKILCCIHRSANMPAVINLLDAACPSKENTISVYVLHLMELIGRSTPIFISHQAKKQAVTHVNSYSANVILYFSQFEKENRGAVNLGIFTAISPTSCMHEDICTLALDKLTSLILLPFHRKWSLDGSIDSEDNTIRTLNLSVLARAPCSVGILVDRGHLGRSTSVVSTGASFSVAVIFMGGKDDREALAFARRMTSDLTIRLTIIHLVPANNKHAPGGEWDRVLDAEVLKDFRYNRLGERHVLYIEEMVKDGPQTAFLLRPMVDEYDIIIVGRRYKVESPQTLGLSEWSEFPELGILGDLLASPDLNCKASILVIQQQQR